MKHTLNVLLKLYTVMSQTTDVDILKYELLIRVKLVQKPTKPFAIRKRYSLLKFQNYCEG